jgi:tRNA 5-methylaminomethyl-2-thiouridine biosynthesis bifunctional protein
MEFRDKTPYSPAYDDIYYSKFGGVGETLHVFFRPNRIRERIREKRGIRIAELGFGTGLNFAVTVNEVLQEKDAHLEYISIEKHPLTTDQMDAALSAFPELADYRKRILPLLPLPLPGFHRVKIDSRIELTLLFGDAIDMLRDLVAEIDAWYLDGFTPAKNPGMWNDSIYAQMARLSIPSSTVSTYSAAGAVRRGLEAMGFRIEKIPGYGSKKEMLAGTFEGPSESTLHAGEGFRREERPWFHIPKGDYIRDDSAIVIGAGVAGSSIAYSLSLRGIHSIVIDREEGAARKASGNPFGILYPSLTAAQTNSGTLGLTGFCHTIAHLNRLRELGYESVYEQCGMLLITRDDRDRERQLKSIRGLPESFVRYLDTREAERRAGVRLSDGGLYFPDAGIVKPGRLCEENIRASGCDTIYNTEIVRIEQRGRIWRVYDPDDNRVAEAPFLILAGGYESGRYPETDWIPISPVFGQIACTEADASSAHLQMALSGDTYITPPREGLHVIGAAYRRERSDERADPNLTALLLADHNAGMSNMRFERATSERASFRAASEDYLPVAGPVPDASYFREAYGGLAFGKTHFAETARHHQGLYILSGLGSKGLAFAPLCAELIASMISNGALPSQKSVIDALNPSRFLIRNMIRNYRRPGSHLQGLHHPSCEEGLDG